MIEQNVTNKWFQKYKSIVFSNILKIGPEDVDRLTYWRINILFSLLFTSVLVGFPVFLTVIPMAVKEGLWGLLFFDTLAAVFGILLLAWPRVSVHIRSFFSLGLLYIIGVIVIFNVGPLSGGPAWLFAFSILSGVLLGFRAALAAICINTVTVIVFGLLRLSGVWGSSFAWFGSVSLMMVATVNYIFLISIVSISVSVLVKGMTQSHENAQKLAQSLAKEREKLLESQQRLEKEIAEHENTEKALSESEKKYRHLFNSAPAGIYEIDFTTFRFVEVNDALCVISGYSGDELLQKDPRTLLTPKSLKRFEQRFGQLQSGDTTVRDMEYEIIIKDGRKKNVILSNDYIYNDGVLKGARVVVHDVTEQKKIQDMMVQSEKMMSIGGLAAGMAHEINNPLAGMIQNAQVIHNRLTDVIPANIDAARESGTSLDAIGNYMEKRGILSQLERIRQAGRRAAEIVDNMLSFARKSDSVKTYHQLGDLLDRSLALARNDYTLRKRFDFKNISIIRKYESGIKPVLCNEVRIEQVFFNLIKNASEAMAEAGVQDPAIVLKMANEKQGVRIEIIDNGSGMDAQTQNRIFEPFFTTKNVGKGTGLGLSVSYFIIVEDHGGEMRVESEPERGTRFIIKLPLTSE
jgi:PAS domain S-box-containing protein